MKYLLMMIDRTTQWKEVVPLAETTADAVSQAFVANWIARYGIPITITSDRGAQFTSETWKKALTRLGISVSTTTAYHPQSNGIIEQFHRATKNALRCAVRSSSSWMRSLPWALLGLMGAPKLETATSTAEVMFGTMLRVPGLCFQEEQLPTSSAKQQLDIARSNVTVFSPETLDLRRFKSSLFISKALRTARFVFVRDDGLGKPSLAPRYTGPFQVVEKNWDSNTFTLEIGKKRML